MSATTSRGSASPALRARAAAPGACATDLTRDLPLPITRTAAEGAAVVIHLATLGADGPTGGFFDDGGPVPW
ncbi:hypothetical protein [Nonomuraea rubra]|uniref:SDR family oxidoreductase n=1 Tax=Nonomuraea rubra TaxID=46180 RepID=A0A7X0P0C3_9ACTN|nr:hypothetical protein [Nonomuraea rubra]MBB6552754.1 hypothetical protein [Nonomuraea rubra]